MDNYHTRVGAYCTIGLGVIFMLLGLGIFIGLQSNYDKLKEAGIKTTGVITEIRRSGIYGLNIRANIIFTTADNRKITARFDDYYSWGMSAGKSVEIYYDPADFRNVAAKPGLATSIIGILLVGGAAFIIVGIRFFIKKRPSGKHKKRLIASGHYVMADTHIVTYKGRRKKGPPFIIHARYSEGGENYTFESLDVLRIPTPYPDKIRVYVDRYDYGVYYVDVESLVGI